jgi:hypothetical protein
VSVGFRTPTPTPPAPEQELWRLAKNGHSVTSRARQVPFGLELRILVDDELWWSRVYRDGHGHWLGEESEKKRGEFAALGGGSECQGRSNSPSSPAASTCCSGTG